MPDIVDRPRIVANAAEAKGQPTFACQFRARAAEIERMRDKLRAISALETAHANATVRKMAAAARAGLEPGGESLHSGDVAIPACAEEVSRLRAALHRISLGSQDSGTTKESLGKEARAALSESSHR